MAVPAWARSVWGFAWEQRTRLQMAVKAAFAAGVSWQLTLLLPPSMEQYAYYAPLGAVLAMYPTVASSLQAAGQTVLGILLGASVALVVDLLLSTNALTVALVIVLGVTAGAIRWLGQQHAWVPITALFVLAIGSPGSPAYIISYVCLTVLGAAVGTIVNVLVFPPLHLRQSRRALETLEQVVVAQLRDLAEGLESDELPDWDDWERRTRAVTPAVATMRQALSDLGRSTRGNPRARRYRGRKERQEYEAQAFRRLALLVEDLVSLFEEVEGEEVPALPFDGGARRQCAAALRHLAELAGAIAEGRDDDEAVSTACGSIEELEQVVSEDPRAGGSDPFVAASIVTTLRRGLGALVSCGGPTAIARHRAQVFG